MLFRARKPLQWDGVHYKPGDVLEIEDGHPRIRAMLEQSHHIEYSNAEKPSEPQGTPVAIIRE